MTDPRRGLAIPVEVDVACGVAGQRCAFRLELMAHVDPVEFVAAVQAFATGLLDESTAPSTEPQHEAGETGSVPVEPVPASRSRGAGTKPPAVAKFDPQEARRRAAEAC